MGCTATQTLGEEYTDIWQYSSFSYSTPSSRARVALILLPTLSAYVLGRRGSTSSFGERYPAIGKLLKMLPVGLEVLAEINLAVFYLRGTYYDIVKRLFGIRHVCAPQLNYWMSHTLHIPLAIFNSRKSAYKTTLLRFTWDPPHCQTCASFHHNPTEVLVRVSAFIKCRRAENRICAQFTRNIS